MRLRGRARGAPRGGRRPTRRRRRGARSSSPRGDARRRGWRRRRPATCHSSSGSAGYGPRNGRFSKRMRGSPIAADPLLGVVGAAVADDDGLPVLVGLAAQGRERALAQELGAVVGRDRPPTRAARARRAPRSRGPPGPPRAWPASPAPARRSGRPAPAWRGRAARARPVARRSPAPPAAGADGAASTARRRAFASRSARPSGPRPIQDPAAAPDRGTQVVICSRCAAQQDAAHPSGGYRVRSPQPNAYSGS